MRSSLWFAVAAALLAAAPRPLAAAEKTLDGGAHIFILDGLGEFRAHVGPRWRWGGFSLTPYGAVGMAFLTGVSGTPLSVGAYGDADYLFDLGEQKGIRVGAGGGASLVTGIQPITGWAVPQGYLQAGYKWGGNFVGVQAIAGPSYAVKDYPAAWPDRLGFSGVGLRFEYEIEQYPESRD
jgi:hypothetical protein